MTTRRRSGSGSQPPSSSPPALKVSRDEAASRIQTQIDEGEAFLTKQPKSISELKDLQQAEQIWSDFNRALLVQLFTSEAVADEYIAFSGGVYTMNPTLAERVGYFRRTSKSR